MVLEIKYASMLKYDISYRYAALCDVNGGKDIYDTRFTLPASVYITAIYLKNKILHKKRDIPDIWRVVLFFVLFCLLVFCLFVYLCC